MDIYGFTDKPRADDRKNGNDFEIRLEFNFKKYGDKFVLGLIT